jgi:H+-translocating NAD(P) transhydrogenase subunit alpha
MKVAFLRELHEGEKRVSAVPATVEKLLKAGIEVAVESEAGLASALPDAEYAKAGARVARFPEVLAGASLVVKVRPPLPREPGHEIDSFPEGAALISSALQRGDETLREKLKRRRISAFSLDLLPRIARAQSMDVLSSMANIAGYKSVLLAANALGKFFPMLMTAAGTILPAKVLVLGAGVAGLQAIATARRLGGLVAAFDVRPAVKEQVESLGARFISAEAHQGAEDARGYAKEVSADAAKREREAILKELAQADVCITTALVPGKKAPILVTEAMVQAMGLGSVIVDLAAEQGGNCEVTEAGKQVVKHGVTILGPLNLPSAMAPQASQLYSRNVLNFLLHVFDKEKKEIAVDRNDEIVRSCLIAHDGEMLQAG